MELLEQVDYRASCDCRHALFPPYLASLLFCCCNLLSGYSWVAGLARACLTMTEGTSFFTASISPDSSTPRMAMKAAGAADSQCMMQPPEKVELPHRQYTNSSPLQQQRCYVVDDNEERDVYVAYPRLLADTPVGLGTSLYLPTYKVLLVGEANVGKSNLLHRYCFNAYDPLLSPTIGAEFYTREVDLPPRQVGKPESAVLQLWDTAGQERYCGTVCNAYFRNATGAFIVFDVTCRASLLNVPRWVARVKELAGEDCVCVVIGAKADLLTTVEEGHGSILAAAPSGSTRPQLSDLREEVDRISHALGLRNFFVSALSGEGVLEAFTHLVLAISAVKAVEAERYHHLSSTGAQLWTPAASVPPGALSFHSPVQASPSNTETVDQGGSRSSTASTASPVSSVMSYRTQRKRLDLRGFGGGPTLEVPSSSYSPQGGSSSFAC